MSALPAHPEQKKILKKFCEEEFKHQTEYLIKKYELKDYKPQLYFNFRTNAVASYGGELNDGEPFISLLALEVCCHVGTTIKYVYSEYDFLQKKEGVGDGVANWKQHVSWTMAHEMAHTLVEVDRFRKHIQPFFPDDVARDLRGHGLFWQAIYRDLRNNFCVEERYPVEYVDFTKAVHFSSKAVNGEKQFTFFRGSKECGWYIKGKNGMFYRSTKTWSRKTPTKYQKPAEIVKRLVSV